MKDVLERLATARGVRAAAVYDNDGNCLASHPNDALAPLGVSLVRLLSSNTARFAAGATEAVMRFGNGTLFVRRTRHAVLAVVGDTAASSSVSGAGFAMNVALQVINLRLGSRRPAPHSATVPTMGEIAEPRPAGLRAPAVPKI
jgi:hypothetical protein